jgi:hypothetical protein
LDPSTHVDVQNVVAEIVGAGMATAWAADFQKPEFAEQLAILLFQHFATSMDIERRWHADATSKGA